MNPWLFLSYLWIGFQAGCRLAFRTLSRWWKAMRSRDQHGHRRFPVMTATTLSGLAVGMVLFTPALAFRIGIVPLLGVVLLAWLTAALIGSRRRRRRKARTARHEQMVGPSPFEPTLRSEQVERALLDLIWQLGAHQVTAHQFVEAVKAIGRPESRMWVTSIADAALADLSRRSKADELEYLLGQDHAMTWLFEVTIGLRERRTMARLD